jgi:hypothetical protein
LFAACLALFAFLSPASADPANRFRVLTAFGGGTLDVTAGTLTADARSNGGNTSAVLLYDPASAGPALAPQTTFPSGQPLRVAFLARAAAAGSSFSVSFADPHNVNNRVSATLILNAGPDVLRFHRDGAITATTSSAGAQVGPDASLEVGSEPGDGAAVPVAVTLVVNDTTPVLTVQVGANPAVTSAFTAGDFDWGTSAVLLRFGDPTAKAGPLLVDQFLVTGAAPVAPPAPSLPPAPGADANLITVNPGFESGSLNNFSGSYAFTGWTGTNALYANHTILAGSVAAGTTTEGSKRLLQSWGGTPATAPAARPVATPGVTYELTYDQRSLVRKFPAEKLGSTPHIEFFDAAGVRIKQVWPVAGPYRVQASGANTWETFTLRAVAPPGSARVGLFFNNPSGRFASNEQNYTQDRHVEMDNIRLTVVPDTADRVAVRRAPRLVEPGKTAFLKLHHLALAPRTLRATLLDAASTPRATASIAVPAGRFRATPLAVAIPANLPDGVYAWRFELLPAAGGPAVAVFNQPGVIVDQSVAASPLNTADFPAGHPRVQWQGRIEELPDGSRIWHWHGSEARLRFSGTSLAVVGVVVPNIYGQHETHNIVAVVNENYAAPITVTFAAKGAAQTVPVITGLPDGIHTVRLYKTHETDRRLRFDRFRVDAGRGLLAFEPLSPRRLEVYGDSVTNASSANFPFNGYSHLLGRELDTDFRNIAKGGTGIASSFVGPNALISNFYDNLAYQDVFKPAAGTKYDMTRWTPHIVLLGFGHNDQFNGGGGTPFNTKYAEMKTKLRAAYPGVSIFSYNTLISANLGHFNNATEPLTAADPAHRFAFQPNPWNDSATAHPPTDAHAAMVFGDERRFSMADYVEDMMGWALESPPAAAGPRAARPGPPAGHPTPAPAGALPPSSPPRG